MVHGQRLRPVLSPHRTIVYEGETEEAIQQLVRSVACAIHISGEFREDVYSELHPSAVGCIMA